jgi:hypothetical protein
MQLNLRRSALPRPAPRRAAGSLQLVRADGPRVTREYREDDGTMYVPDQKPAEGEKGALYADQVQMPVSGDARAARWRAPRAVRGRRRPDRGGPAPLRRRRADPALGRCGPLAARASQRPVAHHSPPAALPAPQRKPQSNISKEMKARLRKEYTSFGGAENSVSGGRRAMNPPWRACWPCAAARSPAGLGLGEGLVGGGAGAGWRGLPRCWPRAACAPGRAPPPQHPWPPPPRRPAPRTASGVLRSEPGRGAARALAGAST